MYLVLSRPELKNAFNVELLESLSLHLEGVPESICGVVLMGAEGFFCSGMDLKALSAAKDLGDSAAYLRDVRLGLQRVFDALDALSCVSVSWVEGGAYGGGVGLSLACDVCCALKSTVFCLSELRQGVLPVQIMPVLLSRLSRSLVMSMLLSAKPYSASSLGGGVIVFDQVSDFVNLIGSFQQGDIRELRGLMKGLCDVRV